MSTALWHFFGGRLPLMAVRFLRNNSELGDWNVYIFGYAGSSRLYTIKSFTWSVDRVLKLAEPRGFGGFCHVSKSSQLWVAAAAAFPSLLLFISTPGQGHPVSHHLLGKFWLWSQIWNIGSKALRIFQRLFNWRQIITVVESWQVQQWFGRK